MKRTIHNLLLLASLVILPVAARADTGTALTSCAEQINECFNLSAPDQSDCFYTSSKHSACTGTPLAAVAFKRWSLSPSTPGQDSSAAALIGPSSVDPACVANCDSPFMAGLIDGQPTKEFIGRISQCYDKCIAEIDPQKLRP